MVMAIVRSSGDEFDGSELDIFEWWLTNIAPLSLPMFVFDTMRIYAEIKGLKGAAAITHALNLIGGRNGMRSGILVLCSLALLGRMVVNQQKALVLVGKGELLDAQPVGITEQTIEIDTYGMGGQFGVQAGTQTRKAMGVVVLKQKLLSQLAVDGLNNLAKALH